MTASPWAACGPIALAVALVVCPSHGAAQADEARARKIVSGVCFLCHGLEGESSSELFPRLAGQHWEYIAKQLENFKSGKRKSTAMSSMVATLAPDDMVALGKYFERQPAPPPVVNEPGLAQVGRHIYFEGNRFSGVPACAGCHGPQGLGTASLPRLASQFASYTEAQLKLFSKRERTNDNAVMHAITEKMTALEMAAVAQYLSGI